MKEEKIVEDLAEVLARTYKKINWRKIGVKNSHDYFTDRIGAASRSNTIGKFLNELTRLCGITYVNIDPQIVERLRENEKQALKLLRDETIYVAMRTIERVEQLREGVQPLESWEVKK
ncbi:MAG TPA: hypothetical protein PKZ88_08075 [Methanothermobacter sp.]|nr:hypothetical protein [Methanothermobacter sp.]